ncbi:MAG: methionyl-tRNA formyltransferase [Chitinophagaceae bacterium]|nr:methionyl-tRNA formyltransferase [Chitinophagaceae bacterium]
MKTFEELRIVFFGTPDFAVASLKAVIEAGGNVVAVVTAPDKPAGRGQHLQASAVKQYAVAQGVPVLQPEKMKSPEFLEELRNLKADLQIVVAFRMMPEVVWNMPPMGTINVHGSLLPQYRGAAPINRAIMNGETETGVTTFKLKHEIDTGDILLQTKVPILPEDNAGSMHDKLMVAGAELLVVTVKGLAEGTLEEIPQAAITTSELRHAPKLFKEDMAIDWTSSCHEINNFVRGLSPYPTAFTHLGEKTMRVYAVRIEPGETLKSPGTYETDHSTYLSFAAKDGRVYILDLQLEGKKRMPVGDFLRGFRG